MVGLLIHTTGSLGPETQPTIETFSFLRVVKQNQMNYSGQSQQNKLHKTLRTQNKFKIQSCHQQHPQNQCTSILSTLIL